MSRRKHPMETDKLKTETLATDSGMRRSGRGGSQTRGSANRAVRQITESGSIAIPQSILYSGFTKRTYGTDTYSDRLQSSIPQFLYWANVLTLDYRTGIQIGASSDTDVSSVFGKALAGMYGNIVRQYQARNNKTLRDTVLDEPNAQGSMAIWLNAYSEAYMTLVGLSDLLAAGEFNLSLRNISAAIMRAQTRLEADLIQLYSFAVPPGWLTVLDKWTGPFAWDQNGVVCMQIPSAGTVPADLTIDASISAILATAETALGVLSSRIAGSSDMLRIANTFGVAYGKTSPLSSKPRGVRLNPVSFIGLLSQVQTTHDTGGFLWTEPNINLTEPGGRPSANTTPIWTPQGASTDDYPYLFSLLRPAVYSVDALPITDVTVANQVGLLAQKLATTSGFQFAGYDQNTTFQNRNTVHTGAAGIGVDIPESNFLWLWQSIAEKTAYSIAVDRHDLLRINIENRRLLDETMYAFETMFIDPI